MFRSTSGCSPRLAHSPRHGTPSARQSPWHRRSSPTTPASLRSADGRADGGTLVGFCTGYQDLHSVRFGYRVWVEDLAVDPEHRSRGVGKALLDAAKGWARERGATHLELDSAEARTDAHRFYEREGAGDRSICFGWDLS